MRQGTRRLGLPRSEIVFEAVFDNASLRNVTVKIEGLKIQLRQMAEQVRFFRDSNEFGLIEESLGQISRTRAFVSRHSTISARSFDVTGKMRVAGVWVWRTTPAPAELESNNFAERDLARFRIPPDYCRILGFATEYRTSVRKFTAT